MKHLDLFSGIGGFALAASWVWPDHEVVSFCEIEPYCRKILAKHWPHVPIVEDIRTMKENRYGSIDLLTGGFPCQPFSCAGKRAGKKDDRYLWPEMLRVIRLFKPSWIVAENVAGLLTIEQGVVFERVLSDLEAAGYAVQPLVIPACAVDAPHRRARVWIVAHATCANGETWDPDAMGNGQPEGPLACKSRWLPEPPVGRVANGIPKRVDRLRALGNAIVPQVAAEIFKAIKIADERGPK